MRNFTELVVSEGELPDGAGVGPVEPDDVCVFDERFPVLRFREVLVAALQMPGFLGFR